MGLLNRMQHDSNLRLWEVTLPIWSKLYHCLTNYKEWVLRDKVFSKILLLIIFKRCLSSDTFDTSTNKSIPEWIQDYSVQERTLYYCEYLLSLTRNKKATVTHYIVLLGKLSKKYFNEDERQLLAAYGIFFCELRSFLYSYS